MKTQSKDQLADQYTSVSVDRSMYYSPALAPILLASSTTASSIHTAHLKTMAPTIDKQPSGSSSTQVNNGKNLENRKEAIVLKDEPNKRTPVMVTPDSSPSDLSCLSSIELIENVEFPYVDDSPDLLLQEPPVETSKGRKGFRPFVRANSLSSSSGSVATVTMSTMLRRKVVKTERKGPLQSLTVDLKRTYSSIDPDFGYTGRANPRRVLTKPSKPATNYGYDNEHNDYIIRVGDIIGSGKNKYRIIDLLGSGTFGQVVKCERVSTQELVSVKIIKNKRDYRTQSMFEADIVQELHRKIKPQDHHYLLNIYETFDHANHFCIVSELLSYSLFEVLKQNNYMGVPIHLVRSFSIQIIDTLVLLKEAKFIHCDLKPENILLKSLDSSEIKVVDYGAACHIGKKPYGYIQSRFYRAPEILLGLPYSYPIDMWSTGCVIGELFLGMPLFPGTSEHNQLRRIIDMLGSPPQEMLNNGVKTEVFFNCKTVNDRPTIYRMKSQEQYNEEQKKSSVPQRQFLPEMGLTDLLLNYPYPTENDKAQELQQRHSLADFLKGLLTVDPEQRWTPKQARGHPFLTGEPYSVPYVPMKDVECDSGNSTKSDTAKGGNDAKPKNGIFKRATEEPKLKPQTQPETEPANITSTAIASTALSTETPISTTLPVATPIKAAMSIPRPIKSVGSAATVKPIPAKEPSKTTRSAPSSIEKILAPVKANKFADTSSVPKNLPSPKPISIMVNGKGSARSPLIGDKRNVIIMPAATTKTPLDASDKTVVSTPATNSILENLRMHYKHGGSPSGVLLTSSPAAAIVAKKSEPDLSKRIKIAPLIKLRRGSHDSFRTPDEIRLPYTSAAPNNLYQHNNTSRVKLDSYSSTGSHDSSDTSDITSNRKQAKHAGEAAGGLLMMRGKQTV